MSTVYISHLCSSKVQKQQQSVQEDLQDEDLWSGFCTFEYSNQPSSPDLWRVYLGNYISVVGPIGLVDTLPIIVHKLLAFDLSLRRLVHLRLGHLQQRCPKKSMVASAQDMEILRAILSSQVDQNRRVGSGTPGKLFVG